MGNWFQGKHTEVGDARALMLDLLGCSKDGRDDGERGWDDLVVEYLGGEYGGGSAPRWPPREPLRTRLVACHWFHWSSGTYFRFFPRPAHTENFSHQKTHITTAKLAASVAGMIAKSLNPAREFHHKAPLGVG